MENIPFLMLLFKNLQERAFITFPSNLVHWFAVLTLGNIFLIPNTGDPCYDLRLIQLLFSYHEHKEHITLPQLTSHVWRLL